MVPPIFSVWYLPIIRYELFLDYHLARKRTFKSPRLSSWKWFLLKSPKCSEQNPAIFPRYAHARGRCARVRAPPGDLVVDSDSPGYYLAPGEDHVQIGPLVEILLHFLWNQSGKLDLSAGGVKLFTWTQLVLGHFLEMTVGLWASTIKAKLEFIT